MSACVSCTKQSTSDTSSIKCSFAFMSVFVCELYLRLNLDASQEATDAFAVVVVDFEQDLMAVDGE